MKRRKALKGMVLFALGTQVVYSCKDKYQAIKSLPIPNLPLSDANIELIETLSQRLLPLQKIEALQQHTTTPFVLTMAHDCLNPSDRQKFIEGYQVFDNYVQTSKGKKLAKLTESEFGSLAMDLENSGQEENTSASFFLRYVKEKNLQYYLSSEYFLTTYRDYEMAPGYYEGCVTI
jgi:hypothetical protein